MYSIGEVATYQEEIQTGPETGGYEDGLLPGERPVGHVTSSAMGPSVGRMLAMAYVETAHSWPGNGLIVEIGGRPVPARVATTPFFDPGNARMKADHPEKGRPDGSRRGPRAFSAGGGVSRDGAA